MWDNEAAAVRMGFRILVRCRDQRQAATWLREMANLPDMQPQPHRNMIDCPSGGFAHFAWNEDQVRGVEYHDALGPVVEEIGLTPEMRSRIRLEMSK